MHNNLFNKEIFKLLKKKRKKILKEEIYLKIINKFKIKIKINNDIFYYFYLFYFIIVIG